MLLAVGLEITESWITRERQPDLLSLRVRCGGEVVKKGKRTGEMLGGGGASQGELGIYYLMLKGSED